MKYLLIALCVMSVSAVYAGTLSCSVTTAAACTGTIVLRMSNSANAHAELPSQSTASYANNVVCCSGVSGLGTSCSGTFATVLKLANTTNSHVQQNSQSGYTNNACLSVSSGSVSIAYQASNCTGYDTTLASIQASTNSHVGNTTAYTTKICGTASGGSQTFTFFISGNSVSFGTLLTAQTRYASSTGSGDDSQVEAHNFAVNTNAGSGYTVTVQGATLTSGSNTITPIGAVNTSPSVGNAQFGLRVVASGGSGVVTSPYSASGFAYAASATTTSQVASASTGDSATTTYSVRYMANISALIPSGSYTTNLVYVATANF